MDGILWMEFFSIYDNKIKWMECLRYTQIIIFGLFLIKHLLSDRFYKFLFDLKSNYILLGYVQKIFRAGTGTILGEDRILIGT